MQIGSGNNEQLTFFDIISLMSYGADIFKSKMKIDLIFKYLKK